MKIIFYLFYARQVCDFQKSRQSLIDYLHNYG